MKKIMIVLLVLAFVAPAIADPNAIDVNFTSAGLNVTLNYSGAAADANRPRAWGLIITADHGATISSVVAVKTGESTSGSPGYGIFPATIAINASGTVTGWGSPVYSGDGTGSVIVELGSLYSGSGNAPVPGGDLLTFTVSGDCNVSVAENAADGCVLDEKGRRKHPTNHAHHVNAGGCGTCPLDITGPDDVPDGSVAVDDLYYLLGLVNGCAYQSCACPS